MNLQQNIKNDTVAHAHAAETLNVSPDTTLHEVLQLLKAENRGHVLVCDDGRLVGIFTERDALKLMADGADLSRPIQDLMVPSPVTVSHDEKIGGAIAKMSQGGYRRLPIVDQEGRPAGVVKVSGILHYLVEHFPGTIYNLPPTTEPTTQEREGA